MRKKIIITLIAAFIVIVAYAIYDVFIKADDDVSAEITGY